MPGETRTLTIPVRTVSRLNTREHWAKANARKRAHQETALLAWKAELGSWKPSLPCSVHLVRIGRNTRRMDPDNLASSAKDIQDIVAALIGVDDGDSRITWTYGQERAARYAVRVEITEGVVVCPTCGQEVAE